MSPHCIKTAAAAALIVTGASGCAIPPASADANDVKDKTTLIAANPSGNGEENRVDLAAEGQAPTAKKITTPLSPESAPEASKRLSKDAVKTATEALGKINTYFDSHVGRRMYVQTDKPLYKPGETIWFRAWDLNARFLVAQNQYITCQLVSPKGAVVLEKMVNTQDGVVTNDFEIPAEVQGGEYLLRLNSVMGTVEEKPVIVSTYEAPRLKKKLEFVRKAYGAGDTVSATLELKRPTGEPLKNKAITAAIRLDGVDLPSVKANTNNDGGALVKFALPSSISTGDGLLTILVEDGGVTESISKRIPIIVDKMQLSFFPEGGQLVEGLAGRVYFEAKNPLGKPADVEGNILDDKNNVVATFKSHKEGLGRVAFTPATGRQYRAEITKPLGIKEKYDLPVVMKDGCVLRSYDDLDGQLEALRVSVQCNKSQKVLVVAAMRDQVLDAGTYQIEAGKPTVVYLKPEKAELLRAQGIARITVFDESKQPLAERLVYRQRRSLLDVKVTAAKDQYGPRDQVVLNIETKDPQGKPVPADLALSVVDDTVISFADDKTGHMLSRVFLENEVPGKVEEPNNYFDLTDDKSALAMDLLMGTRGYTRFDWQMAFNPPPPPPRSTRQRFEFDDDMVEGALAVPMAAAVALEAPAGPKGGMQPVKPAPVAAPVAEKAANKAKPNDGIPAPDNKPMPAGVAKDEAKADRKQAEAQKPMLDPADKAVAGKIAKKEAFEPELLEEEMERRGRGDMADRDWAGAEKKKRGPVGYAPVRVFPMPRYDKPFDDKTVRSDFRETIYWAPRVKTGTDGKAKVDFYLSDAVTSFRVFTEGASLPATGGIAAVGRKEEVIKSSLPFSMSVKLPTEVSAGDQILLPLTLSNERDAALAVDLKATFGPLVTLDRPTSMKSNSLAANARDSLFYPLTVGASGVVGTTPVSFAASASGLRDEFVRELTVVPTGFPIQMSMSGNLKDKAIHTVDTGSAEKDSIVGSIRLYPSPVSTLISGLDGMLREPSGCFEQTSSTNYPNVMIMNYLERNNVADAQLVERSQKLMDSGYRRLTGYESKTKGYEWFGESPGHEALTAYGLLEFLDMKGVYKDVDDAMIRRTADWLLARRDGKGGYQRNDRALDSFGAAAPEVTDAYITYSLAEAGFAKEITVEMERQSKNARESQDAYVLALATNSLLAAVENSKLDQYKADGLLGAKRLAAMQEKTGNWKKANHSITRSGGINLELETSALSIMALLRANNVEKSKTYEMNVRDGINWMQNNRSGFGQWGATQATILSLKAFIRYTEAARKTQGPGSVVVLVNGKEAGRASYEAGHRDPIVLDQLGKFMTAGKNEIKVLLDGKDELPYSIAVEFRSKLPATSSDAMIGLQTKLERTSVKMGESVRAVATVTNKSSKGQPMTLARVGIPGGLSFQTWQLKELRDKGLIGFYETRAREVILYFRDMKPSEVKTIPLDLVATVPGTYEAPASSAYLYYTDEYKTWIEPLRIQISP